jgi:hypothetical protein
VGGPGEREAGDRPDREASPEDYRIEEIDELLRCPCPRCAGARFEPFED